MRHALPLPGYGYGFRDTLRFIGIGIVLRFRYTTDRVETSIPHNSSSSSIIIISDGCPIIIIRRERAEPAGKEV
jgi:hypothetical protein